MNPLESTPFLLPAPQGQSDFLKSEGIKQNSNTDQAV